MERLLYHLFYLSLSKQASIGQTSANSSRTKAHQSLSGNLIYDAAEWAVLRSAVCLVTVRCSHSKLVSEQRKSDALN